MSIVSGCASFRAACLLGLVVAIGCAASRGSEPVPLPKGRVVLKVSALDGSELSLSALRGKVVLVTVVTTWSDPALYEVPRLKALYQKYPREDLEIVCVALDDDPRMVRIFKQSFEIPYQLGTVADRARFTAKDGPLGSITLIPTSFLIDREGRVAGRMDGTWGPNILEAAVAQLTASK